MITKNKIVLGVQMLMLSGLGFAQLAFAQGSGGIQNPINVNSLEDLIAKIVKYALGLTAVLAVAYIVNGGFLYISSAGDESQLKAGKQAIIGAVIGIIVIGLAYALVEFVVNAMGGGGGANGGNLRG